ncbi:P-loop containing nucleoside triphosphate hydrolase protein [Phellopilus nigrolimitatus]|nr:P-loop containing nucleoside triphosphate hydrolase protein [Phellopilus nigrolimitatus]
MSNDAASDHPLLELRNLGCSLTNGIPIFRDVNFTVGKGDIIVLQGKSGCGKTTLLKCLAHLNVYEGEVLYRGKTPKQYGVPNYRTRVLYVPQRPSLLPGTPRDFLKQLSTFRAYKAQSEGRDGDSATGFSFDTRAVDIAESWGVEEALWDRPWTTLSGGEAQRIALAAALGLNCAEVVLLDEPTSALDSESCGRVETYLRNMLSASDVSTKAFVMITHSAEQARRIGTRFVEVADGTCREVPLTDGVV